MSSDRQASRAARDGRELEVVSGGRLSAVALPREPVPGLAWDCDRVNLRSAEVGRQICVLHRLDDPDARLTGSMAGGKGGAPDVSGALAGIGFACQLMAASFPVIEVEPDSSR